MVSLEKKAKEQFYYKCFRHLHLYNIMYYQDELVKLEASFDPNKPWSVEQMKQLSDLLEDYSKALMPTSITCSYLSTDAGSCWVDLGIRRERCSVSWPFHIPFHSSFPSLSQMGEYCTL